MRIKDFGAQVKTAGPGLGEGEFEAIVSVFGNIDSTGDVVLPGAFAKTLAEWAASGDPIPVIWSHDWTDPFSHIGHVIEAKEIDRGLWVKGALDLDNPTAVQVHRLMKGRRVTQFSFAYDVVEGAWVTTAKDDPDFYELRELVLYETGPCLLGANQETELIAAKAAAVAGAVKAGRVLSQKNYDALVEARDAISGVIAAAEPEKTSPPPGGEKTDEPSQADGSPADDEPAGAKSGQAAPPAPRRARAVATITIL